MRIAILEDDTDQADIIRKWLNHAGHTVACHNSGTGFLQAVRHDSYDLYLLDWMVPDVTGIDVLRKLRNERNDYTPAVIATAKDEEQSIVRGLEAGADDYLVKPVRQMELIARVNAILRRLTAASDVAATLPTRPAPSGLPPADRRDRALGPHPIGRQAREREGGPDGRDARVDDHGLRAAFMLIHAAITPSTSPMAEMVS